MNNTTKQIEQALNEAYPVAASSLGEVEDRAIEMRGFRKGFAAARATPTVIPVLASRQVAATRLATPVAGWVSVEKDAARYRWLRDTGDATWEPMALRVPEGARGIDAAIDAAMTAPPAPVTPKQEQS